MHAPLLVDTDVIVDFLRGHPKAVALLAEESARIILSSISVGELYAGVRGDNERAQLDAFIALFRIVPVTVELAKAGGLLSKSWPSDEMS